MSSPTSDKKFVLYHYDPSIAGAVIAIICFGTVALAHTWQAVRSRAWFYIPLVVGAYFECAGYVGRALSHQDPTNLTFYIMQTILLLLAPSLFAATIYMTLGRIVRACHAEHHLFVNVNKLTRIFVFGDVASFLLQGAGGGMEAGKKAKSLQLGQTIILVGLGVQIVFFGVFVTAGVLFHVKMSRDTRRWTVASEFPWSKHMAALFAASFLILVRCAFRVVEFAQGNNGYIVSNEWFLYVFDAILMFAVLTIFNIVHGSELKDFSSQLYTRADLDMEALTKGRVELDR